ncbi:DUF2231 domain-containing protein [Nocardia jinanensis]|nr:DUF2231 domain-containing protein [Nocardia jinanensis]
MNLHRVLRGVEEAGVVDRPAAVLSAVADRVVGRGRTGEWLRGSWLGHPVHPLLVTMPIGAWSSAAVLRLTGRYDAAQHLVLIGLAATVPTVVTGLAEVRGLDTPQRRVALIHASANTVGSALFLGAYLRREHQRHATILGAFGLAAVGVGGALGGHLSYALGAGVHRWQTGPSTTPPDIPVQT